MDYTGLAIIIITGAAVIGYGLWLDEIKRRKKAEAKVSTVLRYMENQVRKESEWKNRVIQKSQHR